MRFEHTHHLGGPGRVIVTAPELPVFITIDKDAEYRSVDILADLGQAAWAGGVGPGGVMLGIEVGRPTLVSSLKNRFRQGSYSSGGGSVVSGPGHARSVRATGRGSVACGGDLTGNAIGTGSRVSGPAERKPLPAIGVHITAPVGSLFEIKSAQALMVHCGGKTSMMYSEQFLNGPWAVSVIRDQIVVSR